MGATRRDSTLGDLDHCLLPLITDSFPAALRESDAAKKAEAARKKAERDALLAEEEKSLPSRSGPKNSKTAQKKTRGLDLSQLDGDDSGSGAPLAALNASGIDNALDALGLTDTKHNAVAIDRHPERRLKSAFEAFRERREQELKGSGLNHGALQQRIRKDWDRAPENPKRQMTGMNAKYNATKEEMAQLRAQANEQTESRLAEK